MKNSTHFASDAHTMEIEDGDLLVSFDVVSLFTQVPIDEALKVIEQRLKEDETLMDRTSIPVEDICELTKLCLKSTYFQYQDQFYEQIEGAAMGSPLSPIIANIYMEHFEEKTLSSAPLKPKVWRRYVDDTFVLWSHSQETLEAFLNHLTLLVGNAEAVGQN